MLRSFVLMVLAVAFALAGAGRMEAAASHCLKLAAAEQAQAIADEAPACHKTAHDKAPAHKPAPHHVEVCMCLTLAKAATWDEAASASAKIEQLPWLRPAAIAFVSNEPAPERPPPRA